MSIVSDILPEFGKELISKEALTETCPSCNSTSTLIAEVQSRYFEIHGFSIFPLGLELTAQCSSCGYKSELESLPDSVKQSCLGIIKNTRIPIRYYKGLLLFILFTALFSLYQHYKSSELVGLLENPKVGDLYITNTDKNTQGYAIVVAVYSNEVYLTFHRVRPDFLYSNLYRDAVVEVENAFVPHNRSGIYQLYKSGFILDVERIQLPENITFIPKRIRNYKEEVKDVAPRRAPSKNKISKAAKAVK